MLTPVPTQVTDLALDLTTAAHYVMAHHRQATQGEPDAARLALATGATTAWEFVTGTRGQAALDLARTIANHPGPVRATVIPF